MNRVDSARRAQIFRCLCEGNSLRATAMFCNCAINTVVKLLLEVGTACSAYQDATVRNLRTTLIQVDETWTFVGCKKEGGSPDKVALVQGDVWTWTAMDADSKLMITWLVGLRSDLDCQDFIDDLADRLTLRIQLSGIRHDPFQPAVYAALRTNVDSGQIVRVLGQDPTKEKRHIPATNTSRKTDMEMGDPLDELISTSDVKRKNLKIPLACRRSTRLAHTLSKRLEKHCAAFALFAMFYNFCRPHQALTKDSGDHGRDRVPTTPAMASGLSHHAWTVEELLCTILSS